MFLGQVGLHGLITQTAKPVRGHVELGSVPEHMADMDTITSFCDPDRATVDGWLRGAQQALALAKRNVIASIAECLREMDASTDRNEKLGMIAVVNMVEYAFDLPASTIDGRNLRTKH